ncbi:MAG: hypothetical protein LBG11_00515 [Bifidobacteriaceae bacterium]|jgi:hypothetical protein|nr:hypothetical protein [Bifidobacteriaceae bacterium]
MAAAAALVVGACLALAGCSDQAKEETEDYFTGGDKIADAVGAAIGADLGTIAQEVASWYSGGENGDPKIVASGGSYYICAAAAGDCVADGQIIAPATDGAQVSLARGGKDNWCLEASLGGGQTHITSDLTPKDGPC